MLYDHLCSVEFRQHIEAVVGRLTQFWLAERADALAPTPPACGRFRCVPRRGFGCLFKAQWMTLVIRKG